MCLVSEAWHYLALTQFKICGSRLENPLSPFLFQFQEMLKQYEENLNNERIEKTRLSEDYESKIQMLTSVRNQVNFQPTIFSREFLSVGNESHYPLLFFRKNNALEEARLGFFTPFLNAVANAGYFPFYFLWNLTKNTEMHAGRTRPLRFCSRSKLIILFLGRRCYLNSRGRLRKVDVDCNKNVTNLHML